MRQAEVSGEQHSPECTHWQCAPGCDVSVARNAERFGHFIEPLPDDEPEAKTPAEHVRDRFARYVREHINPLPEAEVPPPVEVMRVTGENLEGERTVLRWVTCVSCGGTFIAREYPPAKCELCEVSFDRKVLTKVGDTIESVQRREARKQLRKGKRK